MSIKEKVLELLKKHHKLKTDKLKRLLKIPKKDLVKILDELALEEKIFFPKEKTVCFYIFIGTIVFKHYGIRIYDNESKKEFILDKNKCINAKNKDTVLFCSNNTFNEENFLPVAIINKIYKRYTTFSTGEIIKEDNIYKVKSVFNDIEDIVIKNYDENKYMLGQLVKINVTSYTNDNMIGEIVEIIGHKDDPSKRILSIAKMFDFNLEFSKETVDELNNLKTSVNPNDYKDRIDYSDKLVITIDSEDAKDFDDAISLETNDDSYTLYVFISDVSEYVKENTSLDNDALNRGTSVYLASTVIPMLPHQLSSNVCSLVEGEYRLVLAVKIELTKAGKIISYDINKGIIKSTHRMTYTKVNKILDNDEELIKQYSDIYQMILNMSKLSEILRDLRYKKGAIEFDTVEYKIKLDNKYEVSEVNIIKRGKSELLIEDFMLLCNETIAYHMDLLSIPCCYRIHEKPDIDKVEQTLKTINNMGVIVSLPELKKIKSYHIQKTMEVINQKEEAFVLNQLMLRSMMKAKYHSKCIGHFGLAMRHYCHFTSPIRRYPDLMVHRILKDCLLSNDENTLEKIKHYDNIVDDVCVSSSILERKAIDCERAVNDFLISKYMAKNEGKSYSGIITSIQSFGFYVMLDNGIEGMVSVDSLDDYYRYDGEKNLLFSKNNTIKLGQRVDVISYVSKNYPNKVSFLLNNDNE